MKGSLNYYILLSVDGPAYFMFFTRRYMQLIS